ncbi:MAG: hypothetical protein ACXVH2_09055 [Methanobacterium sp.]
MVDVDNWTVKCKKCGVDYEVPKEGKIKVYSLKKIKFKEKPECPVCGHSSSISTLKHYIGHGFNIFSSQSS